MAPAHPGNYSQSHILSGGHTGQRTAQFIQPSSMRGPTYATPVHGWALTPGLAGLSLPLPPILAVVRSSRWVLIFFEGLAPPPTVW